jgi:hypothetical protein
MAVKVYWETIAGDKAENIETVLNAITARQSK